jgi:hypothetical protein
VEETATARVGHRGKAGMTKPQKRHRVEVAHMTIETIVCPRGGTTFAVHAGNPDDKKPNFTGFIKPGMAAELLELSAHVRQLERDMKD